MTTAASFREPLGSSLRTYAGTGDGGNCLPTLVAVLYALFPSSQSEPKQVESSCRALQWKEVRLWPPWALRGGCQYLLFAEPRARLGPPLSIVGGTLCESMTLMVYVVGYACMSRPSRRMLCIHVRCADSRQRSTGLLATIS